MLFSRPLIRRAALILLPPLLLILLGLWGLSEVGQWLVVQDPLQEAGAIVVVGGHLPFRAMEAASLYRQGWAPEVWLTRGLRPAEELALARLGIQFVRKEAYNQQVLQRLGVPLEAIRLLNGAVQNTVEEMRAVAHELSRRDNERIILVTSKPHSRRVKATWRAVVGNSAPVIVRWATEDPYDAHQWWRNTRDALSVFREVLGLINMWAGFPVQPKPVKNRG